jgi:hypothetical protein
MVREILGLETDPELRLARILLATSASCGGNDLHFWVFQAPWLEGEWITLKRLTTGRDLRHM